MVKVNSLGGGSRDSMIIRESQELVNVVRPEISFKTQLNQVRRENLNEELSQLLEDVDRAAEKLREEKTIPALRNYKEKVRNFIRAVTERAYELKEGRSWNSRGGQKIFVLVRKIDSYLEKLTEQILDEQKEGIDLLDRLDEIRGILIDMFA